MDAHDGSCGTPSGCKFRPTIVAHWSIGEPRDCSLGVCDRSGIRHVFFLRCSFSCWLQVKYIL